MHPHRYTDMYAGGHKSNPDVALDRWILNAVVNVLGEANMVVWRPPWQGKWEGSSLSARVTVSRDLDQIALVSRINYSAASGSSGPYWGTPVILFFPF